MALGSGASTAQAANAVVTVNERVPLVFRYGTNAETGQCDSVVFVQWKHVPNTIRAAAHYSFDARPNDYNVTKSAPYDDSYVGVNSYTVQPGFHWIKIQDLSQESGDCGFKHRMHTSMFETDQIFIELTFRALAPRITSLRGRALLTRARRAAIGTVTCPAGGDCTVHAPKHVNVRANGRVHRLRVVAPEVLGDGKLGQVRVIVPASAAAAFKNRSVRVRVKVTARNHIEAHRTSTVSRLVRGR